ncbi:MAG: hypothetical protein F6J93_31795 [Oscillatoria sp. SIO1A7]|nr:hypothetical protein [Oscillatoria sp. SIO1A7]
MLSGFKRQRSPDVTNWREKFQSQHPTLHPYSPTVVQCPMPDAQCPILS